MAHNNKHNNKTNNNTNKQHKQTNKRTTTGARQRTTRHHQLELHLCAFRRVPDNSQKHVHPHVWRARETKVRAVLLGMGVGARESHGCSIEQRNAGALEGLGDDNVLITLLGGELEGVVAGILDGLGAAAFAAAVPVTAGVVARRGGSPNQQGRAVVVVAELDHLLRANRHEALKRFPEGLVGHVPRRRVNPQANVGEENVHQAEHLGDLGLQRVVVDDRQGLLASKVEQVGREGERDGEVDLRVVGRVRASIFIRGLCHVESSRVDRQGQGIVGLTRE
ncbi:hypothetical protein CAOG_009929 [Capsaspora owczarzaki ATCC 30864]|uniref:Uncharacterized protein n=1 Tax=Capsaspora owczarzaki (strain ATCC 30864) TaxID=595528 RepID=A0A0D2WT21_CAPO3|nr:hypothetical protein CAOG_009929 [Capsaspora owczarzaki ATCC 30864]